jgi:DNA-binding CsgD family transcriptional regulator
MKRHDDIIHAIYGAALSPEKWPDVLSRIGARFDAEGAVILFYSGETQVDFIHCAELEDAVRVYLSEEWWKRDIHAQRMRKLQLAGNDVYNDYALVTEEEIESLPIYVDFFQRVGFGWLMSGVILPDFDMLVVLSVPRAKAKGPFTESEMDVMRSLSRHAEQSLRVSLRISNLESTQGALLAGLDRIEAGIYALDEDARLLVANKAGKEQFADFFSLVDDQIAASAEESRSRFASFLQSAPDSIDESALPRPCVLTGKDRRRVAIWSIPITEPGQHRMGTRGTVSRLLLTIPIGPAGQKEAIDPSILRDIFDLTLGEARLASLIGGGMRVSAAARKLGVAEGTARVVLKRVFEKLGINRQAELVLQLSALGGLDLP